MLDGHLVDPAVDLLGRDARLDALRHGVENPAGELRTAPDALNLRFRLDDHSAPFPAAVALSLRAQLRKILSQMTVFVLLPATTPTQIVS